MKIGDLVKRTQYGSLASRGQVHAIWGFGIVTDVHSADAGRVVAGCLITWTQVEVCWPNHGKRTHDLEKVEVV